MPTVRTKMKQLRDADIRFISLVDRAATRIPFRVMKRDKEQKMGIDLTTVFKRDDSVAPYVSALVVFAQKNEAAGTQILDAIKAHGFKTNLVQKSDEGETLVYAQGDQSGESMVVRLSDQLLVTVGGLKTPSGWVGEMVEEQAFFPDPQMAAEALQQRITEAVTKSETPQEALEADLTSYAEYLNQLAILPAACFKLDAAIGEIVKKCSCEEPPKKDAAAEVEKGEKDETEEEKKKRVKNHPPSEMAPPDEEDDQKPPPDEAQKSEILAALKGIEERTSVQLSALAEKLETVATEQVAQKKVLDDVVQKADTLGTKIGTTVSAPPVSEDRPANHTRMRVQKDDDPRTGNFDTAFLRRRR